MNTVPFEHKKPQNTANPILEALDTICPMHVILSATGHILHAGPTLQKLRPERSLENQRFLEVFALKRPRSLTMVRDLKKIAGAKLHLQFRDPPTTTMKGVLVPGPVEGQMIVNLSFGISVVDAVREYALTNTDFAPTDLTIEMLYLVEAKSAAMEASRKLNIRLQDAMIAAKEQAFTDTLTGLKNRRAFDYLIERQISSDRAFALMQIDLDFFKAVNDTHGHGAGDHVLQSVSRIMRDQVRETDIVARLGGDEFAILFPDTIEKTHLISIGRRIISKLEVPIRFQNKICQISASIGTAIRLTGDKLTAGHLYENADLALYASKRAGRAQQTFYSDVLAPDDAKDPNAPIPIHREKRKTI